MNKAAENGSPRKKKPLPRDVIMTRYGRERWKLFTEEQYAEIQILLDQTKGGDERAVENFLAMIRPWVQEQHQRIVHQIFGGAASTEEEDRVYDALIDAILHAIDGVRSGRIKTWWSSFRAACQHVRRDVQQESQGAVSVSSLDSFVPNPHAQGGKDEYEEEPWTSASHEPSRVPLHETVQSAARTVHDRREELREAVAQALSSLAERKRTVLILHRGLGPNDPHTLAEIGEIFGLSRERVRQIEGQAIRNLQHPWRATMLEGFLPRRPGKISDSSASSAPSPDTPHTLR